MQQSTVLSLKPCDMFALCFAAKKYNFIKSLLKTKYSIRPFMIQIYSWWKLY